MIIVKKYKKKTDAILAFKHFKEKTKHVQFIIIDQFENTTNLKSILCQRLIKRESFWIKTL